MKAKRKQLSGGMKAKLSGRKPILLQLLPAHYRVIKRAAKILGTPMTRLVTNAAVRRATIHCKLHRYKMAWERKQRREGGAA